MTETIRFLLIYDHVERLLVGEPRAFVGDAAVEAALDAYDEAESQYADRRSRFEVLLVGSDSLETVKVTHGRFFPGTSDPLGASYQSLPSR